MDRFRTKLQSNKQQRLAAGLWRQPNVADPNLLNFCSNDYLSLRSHPAVIEAYQQGLARYGTGSGGSPLVSGYQQPHYELEVRLAEWLGREAVVLLGSGYAANHAVVSVLAEHDVNFLFDKRNHASMYDACTASQAVMQRFNHNDMDSLCKRASRQAAGTCAIASEGIFSMDGDAVPLAQCVQTKAKLSSRDREVLLWLDDAHGLGVTGPGGRGVGGMATADEVNIISATFGKAFAMSGAFVAGDKDFIEAIWQSARHYIYSTAFSAAQAMAISKVLDILQTEPDHQQRLQANIEYFKQGLLQFGWRTPQNNLLLNHAIQPVLCYSNQRALALSQALRQQNILCSAIRPPTVPPGRACLRFTLNSAHTREQLDLVLDALGEYPHA